MTVLGNAFPKESRWQTGQAFTFTCSCACLPPVFSSGERLFRGMAKAEMGLGRNNRAVGAFDIRNTGACGLQASESRMAGSFAVGTCRGRVL